MIELVVENQAEPGPEPEPEPTPAPTPTPTPGPPPGDKPSVTAPKTGDDTVLPWLQLILSFVGMVSIGGYVLWQRRKRGVVDDG